MAHPMDDGEVAAFLDALPARTGKMATVRADGRPHVAPIWFALDRAESYGARNGVPGELVVRLRPARVVAVAGLSD